MSIITKLQIEDTSLNVLWFRFSFNQSANINGFPSSKPTGGIWDLTFETQKDDLFFNKLVNKEMITYLKIVITPAKLDTKSKIIELRDVHVIEHKNNFNGINSDPMKTYVKLSPASMVKNGETIFVKYWKITDPNVDTAIATKTQAPTPTVTSIDWIHPETKEIVKEITYGEDVALTAQIENPEGNTAKIFITKEDGTEFEKVKTELTYEEAVTEDGYVELSPLKTKEKWETFKTANVDQLIAKIDHNGYQKKSKRLTIKPKAKVAVYFSPGTTYNGDHYGLDWMRYGETTHPGDVSYKTVVGSNDYSKDANGNYLVDGNGNLLPPVFNQKDSVYKKLLKKYKKVKHPIVEDEKYIVPVLSLLLNKTAKLSLIVDVVEDAKKIVFKYDNSLFNLNKTDVSHKTKGKKPLNDYLEIECIKEFNKKEEIEVFADDEFAGKMIVLPNNKKHRYKADILFVEVETAINGIGSNNIGNPTGRDTEFTKYFNQAFANAQYSTTSLDLSSDAAFNSNFSSAGNIIRAASGAIQDHMIDALYKEYDAKGIDYRKHYKIFFIRESAGGLYGASHGVPSKKRSVAVYTIGFADSTLAHETLHAMGLSHPFHEKKLCFKQSVTDNIMDYSDFEAVPPIPVISTWHRQWETLWKNLDKE